jgi:solute carrier family 25 phosphate transporter 3
MSPYRSNPFFSTASTFFLPSVGDKVDNAVAQGKDLARDAQNKGQEMLGKADNKVQDAKEAVKTAATQSPTGVDLYARYAPSFVLKWSGTNSQVRACWSSWLCRYPRCFDSC